MKRNPAVLAAILLCLLVTACAAGCAGRSDGEGDEDLAPFLFQESFEIWPSPAELYRDVTFYFGWKDHDGDMENPTISVHLDSEAGVFSQLDAENIKVESDTDTAGSISFTVPVLDGYQGDFYVVVYDEAGRASNEISRFLYVNTVPPEDEVE